MRVSCHATVFGRTSRGCNSRCWPSTSVTSGGGWGGPQRIKSWSLTSLQHRLMKTGGRLLKLARYYWLLLAEGHLNRRLFGDMLHKIWALPLPRG